MCVILLHIAQRTEIVLGVKYVKNVHYISCYLV